ncbi:MAG: exodeoxyribonuclease III [Planctomycetaceae bacterium]
MRITTWNVNGLRAAIRKGFAEHIAEIQPDVLLLQEVRALPEQLPEQWQQPHGWHVAWHPADRRGYSGTAIWSRFPINDLRYGHQNAGRESDIEGRLITVSINGLSVSCVYLPSGSSGEHRQAVKEQWMRKFRRWAGCQGRSGPTIFGGDLNIAHTEQDIFYARANEKTSGFLPHERRWFSRLLDSGWHDLAREHFGEMQGPYSWWSNRGRARELDRGWRIDYLLANADARSLLRSATIHREAGQTVSDHAPVSVDLHWP